MRAKPVKYASFLRDYVMWQAFHGCRSFFGILLTLLCAVSAFAAEDGKIVFLQQWGSQGDGPGQFDFPISIAINSADEVYVSDNKNHRLQKFDAHGKWLASYATLPSPGAIALDKAGNIHVTHLRDAARNKERNADTLSVYNPEGKMLRHWGTLGDGPGEFDCPGGLVVTEDGTVFVADQTNHRVQVFSSEGRFLYQWGAYGNEPGQFGGLASKPSRVGGPQFIAKDAAGNFWTTEGANCRIQKFSKDGKPLLAWGTNENRPGGFGGGFTGFNNRPAGKMQGPIALCFDKEERLWISAVCGRIQQFTKDGKYLRGLVEEQGKEPGHFYAPHGLAFDSAGNLFVVDAFNHRIQKFAVPQ